MRNTSIWYGLDVSVEEEIAIAFFNKWGHGTGFTTERFSHINNPDSAELLVTPLDKMQASSVEDVPQEVVLAVNWHHGGFGEKLVARPIS